MSIRDISNAQAAYQQDWRKLYQQPLEFIGDINKTADGYRALQQNLDTQDWRTQAINSENEMSTINDALKNEQIEGLRQYMMFNKNNTFDANGNKIGYDTQLKGLAQDPNSNPFAFNYMREQQPTIKQSKRGGGYSRSGGSRSGYGKDKWYDGFLNRAYRNAAEGEVDPETGKVIYTGGLDRDKLQRMIEMEAILRPEKAIRLAQLKQQLDPNYRPSTPSQMYGGINEQYASPVDNQYNSMMQYYQNAQAPQNVSYGNSTMLSSGAPIQIQNDQQNGWQDIRNGQAVDNTPLMDLYAPDQAIVNRVKAIQAANPISAVDPETLARQQQALEYAQQFKNNVNLFPGQPSTTGQVVDYTKW